MVISSHRIATLCRRGVVFFLLLVLSSAAQSAFDPSRECYELNAEMGKEEAIRFWSEPAESGDR